MLLASKLSSLPTKAKPRVCCLGQLVVVLLVLLSQLHHTLSQSPPVIGSNCTGHAVIVTSALQPLAAGVGDGGNCSSSQSWDLAAQVNAALVNDIMRLWFSTSCQAEVCQSVQRMALMSRLRWTSNTGYLNVDKEAQLNALLQFRAIAGDESNGQPIFTTAASHVASAATRTVYESKFAGSVFTAGPSVFDLAETAYRFVIEQRWTYIALVTSSNQGDQLLAGRLQQLAQTGSNVSRLCLGLLLTIGEANATTVAQQLRSHVYVYKKLARLSVLVAAPAEAAAQLLDLTNGAEVSYADTGHRYQWILVGNSARYVGQLPGNETLGAVLIQAGTVDYSPASDPVVSRVLNATLNWLAPRFPHCAWSDPGSPCYASALDYDRLLLSLLPLLSQPAAAWTNASLLSALRTSGGELNLATYLSLLPYYRVFTDQGYSRFSLTRGLYHVSRGFSAPAVKVLNVQLVAGARRLMKVGELTVDTSSSEAKRTFSTGPVSSRFYVYSEASGVWSEASSCSSQCFGVCPECAAANSWSGLVEFSPGDYYIGAIAPVHYSAADRMFCSDGSFSSGMDGSYQFALVAKFMAQVANHLGNASATPPPLGFSSSLLDQQFLSALTSLMASVARVRGKWPTMGYVIVDSCYLGTHTARSLHLLLSGQLVRDAPGLHYSNVLGFVGALSSTCTMAASEVLKQFSLPLISYGSTSTALNSTTNYPYVARTVVTDRVIVQSIVQLLRYLQVDYTAIVYADTDYGRSLRDQLLGLAADAGICVRAAFAHTVDDPVTNANLAQRVAAAGARYVPFLGSLPELTNFLDFPAAESTVSAVTFVTPEAVATSASWMAGRHLQLGAGCLSVGISSGESPAFAAHQRSLLAEPPADAGPEWPRWLSAYFQAARQCYLANDYGRTSTFDRPCAAAADTSGLGLLDSRVQLAVDAASSLILGGLTAIDRICQTRASGSCDAAVQNSSYAAMERRGNLILFGNEVGGSDAKPQAFGSYRKISDDRSGSNELSLWQFRNQSGIGWGYMQIGTFADAALSMRLSRASIQAAEKSPAQAACSVRAAAGCTGGGCINFGGPAATGSVPQFRLLALLSLLLLPGIVLGFFAPEIWRHLLRGYRRIRGAIDRRSRQQQQRQQQEQQPHFEMQLNNERPLPQPGPGPAPAPKPRKRLLTPATDVTITAGSSHGNQGSDHGNGNSARAGAVAPPRTQSSGDYAEMLEHPHPAQPQEPPHHQHQSINPVDEGSYENDT